MSTFSSIRAASDAQRRTPAYINPDKQRIPSAPNADQTKPYAQGGFGVNASDRREIKRSPFRPSDDNTQAGARPRDTAPRHVRDENTRSVSTAKRLGADAARGEHDSICVAGFSRRRYPDVSNLAKLPGIHKHLWSRQQPPHSHLVSLSHHYPF